MVTGRISCILNNEQPHGPAVSFKSQQPRRVWREIASHQCPSSLDDDDDDDNDHCCPHNTDLSVCRCKKRAGRSCLLPTFSAKMAPRLPLIFSTQNASPAIGALQHARQLSLELRHCIDALNQAEQQPQSTIAKHAGYMEQAISESLQYAVDAGLLALSAENIRLVCDVISQRPQLRMSESFYKRLPLNRVEDLAASVNLLRGKLESVEKEAGRTRAESKVKGKNFTPEVSFYILITLQIIAIIRMRS